MCGGFGFLPAISLSRSVFYFCKPSRKHYLESDKRLSNLFCSTQGNFFYTNSSLSLALSVFYLFSFVWFLGDFALGLLRMKTGGIWVGSIEKYFPGSSSCGSPIPNFDQLSSFCLSFHDRVWLNFRLIQLSLARFTCFLLK